jgi:hypothetical protein
MILTAFALSLTLLQPPTMPENLHHIWLEAESFAPLKGANFAFMPETQQTRGSWSLAGPDAAPAWTQGGESEFMSVAVRADGKNLTIRREVEFPAAGTLTLWVRYADYRGKREQFDVRVIQGEQAVAAHFGATPVIDELDPMKLMWDWAYGWGKAEVTVRKGKARIELVAENETEARRCVDCLCFTNDPTYTPAGREKPNFAAWKPLRDWQQAGKPDIPALARRAMTGEIPAAWRIADSPPVFLWNAGQPWLDELKKPLGERVDAPFSVDPPLLPAFLQTFAGKQPALYSHPLSGAVLHIPLYPAAFAEGSPLLDWLRRHPDRKFGILLNYGEPNWQPNSDKAKVIANLKSFGDQFVGYVAGENIAYANVDTAGMEASLKTVKSRREALTVLRKFHSAATIQKFSDIEGRALTEAEAWKPVISCLSATNEAWVHVLCDWGVGQIGHENTGNSPTLARRLAFLRGACRQFGTKLVNYQSCNLGDSATMFSREAYFYPASSRYVMDNSYDAWAGAGVAWLLRDYLLWHLAGVAAFYNEQGVDLYWKPGGNSAGDTAPVQLSPKGKVAETALNLAAKHPRGAQFTPIAFLLDEAHGYTQERFEYGAWGLNPQINPAVLMPGRHEAAIRGWFDLAYFPAPITQGEPASAIRQTYVSGVFGDVFDVIVNAPKRTAILHTYPVVIAAGELDLTPEWGRALREYVRRGGTLVVCADSLTGAGVGELSLAPILSEEREASAFFWNPTGSTHSSNAFRYRTLFAGRNRILATANGDPVACAQTDGKGQIITIGVPLGLGIDERPVPLLSLLMQSLTAGQVPIQVRGDVEWTLNKLDDGSWLVALFNNRGIIKPTHGVLPTDQREAQTVTLHTGFSVKESAEWLTVSRLDWKTGDKESTLTLTVPAGAVRLIHLSPR